MPLSIHTKILLPSPFVGTYILLLIFGLDLCCRRLSELALLYCQKIGNYALSEVGRGCKYLQTLNLVDCSSIGDDAICGIARGCRDLKKLHIRRCYEVLLPLNFFQLTSFSFSTSKRVDCQYLMLTHI